MVIFTYNDYLDCNSNYALKKIINMENKIINKKYYIKNKFESDELEEKIDYLIDKILCKKEEVISVLDDFLKSDKLNININNLEKIGEYKYKIKGKEIFLFIKVQKVFNYHMPYIILEECMDFINHKKKILNSNKPPIIVPIVIYIGKEKINVKKGAKLRYTSFDCNKINLSYNLIDFTLYNNNELINKKSIISKLMVIKRDIDVKIKNKILKNIEFDKNKFNESIDTDEIQSFLLT